jgi:hypothetical protein
MQIPVASTATKQNAGNLDRFINFLCPLNIIYPLLLQASTGTVSKLFRPSSCNPQSKIYNLSFFTGVLAQLVERLNGIEEVTGSNPVGSMAFYSGKHARYFWLSDVDLLAVTTA